MGLSMTRQTASVILGCSLQRIARSPAEVNSHGVVVGFGNLTDTNGDFAGFVAWGWSEDQGIVPLDDLLAPTFASEWQIRRTHSINDSGQIVGRAVNLLDGTQHAVLLTPVPEPASPSLLAGFVALVTVRRR